MGGTKHSEEREKYTFSQLRDELSRSDSLKEKRVYGWVGGRSLVSASAPQERWGALDRASKSLGQTSERHMAPDKEKSESGDEIEIWLATSKLL